MSIKEKGQDRLISSSLYSLAPLAQKMIKQNKGMLFYLTVVATIIPP